MEGKRRFFDRNFKINAVLMSYEKDTIEDYAHELGILPCILTRWRKEYIKFGTAAFQGSGYVRVHPDNKELFELEKRNRESQMRYEILKIGSPFLAQGKTALYQFIKENEKKYGLLRICGVLGIGNGAYIRWKYKGISEKQRYLTLVKNEITSIFHNSKKRYGKNQIAKEMQSRGFKIGHRMVSLHMKRLGLRRVKKRKFVVTTNSKHGYYTPPNILDQKFKVNNPSKYWVSDITYIRTSRGFLYLTIIMDLYDRKIVGWSLGSGLSSMETVVSAWEMAVINRSIGEGLVFHSDRGVQYASNLFADKLESCRCFRSMSRKGNHLDNAVAESFFSILKRELLYKETRQLSPGKIKAEIFEYIENWYNKKRIHSFLDYKTIEEFNNTCIEQNFNLLNSCSKFQII